MEKDYKAKFYALVKAINDNAEDVNGACVANGGNIDLVPVVRIEYIATEMEQ